MSTTLVRVADAESVVTIAKANRVSYTRTTHAASVTLPGVVYFWAA